MTTLQDTRAKQSFKNLFHKLFVKLIELIKQEDTPHNIGLGMALGVFIGILPIMGIQMTVVALIALPLRANLKAALAAVWISNPITFIPMYWGYYRFGLLFFPSRAVTWEQFGKIVSAAGQLDWTNISDSASKVLGLSMDILIPMWTGATFLAFAFFIPSYFVTCRLVVSYRNRKEQARV